MTKHIKVEWIEHKYVIPPEEYTSYPTQEDYKKYTKKDNKGMWYTFCFIPILRVVVLLGMYWLTVASKEDLDKLFDKKED